MTVNPGTRQVCWSVEVQGVDLPLVAAHIHMGNAEHRRTAHDFLIPAGETDADGSSDGCATVDRMLARGLLRHPEEYYVNVHTALFPAGAARGQLG